ncbi:hypothetical protein B0T19DRAFT_5808 [Cercophora scortea]|uniref:Uncharacterized protein n=1 Tax=Cercophora scortea TaxID=314031 RepID=A0AAE0J2J3_9PEZI|nr:hypothetical protein B0T19DRAFT_5808 [Cercophora scortea]
MTDENFFFLLLLLVLVPGIELCLFSVYLSVCLARCVLFAAGVFQGRDTHARGRGVLQCFGFLTVLRRVFPSIYPFICLSVWLALAVVVFDFAGCLRVRCLLLMMVWCWDYWGCSVQFGSVCFGWVWCRE